MNMKIIWLIACACIVVSGSGCGTENGNSSAEKEFVRQARRHAVTFSMDEGGKDRMLDAIGAAVGDARVVAVSESAHNVKEFITVNTDIAKYLIENKGFDIVVTESAFPESMVVNDYIQGKDIGKSVWTSSLTDMYGRWDEFAGFVEWMREYNMKAGDGHKVRFYGLDITGFYTDIRPTFSAVTDVIEEIDPDYAGHIRAELLPVLDILASGGLRKAVSRYGKYLTLSQRYLLEEKLNGMIEYLESGRERFLVCLGEEKYELLKQETVSLYQTVIYYRNAFFQKRPYREFVGLNGRDLAMAKNFQWIYGSDTTARVVIICHNIHTKTRPVYLDDTFEYFIPFCAFVQKAFGDGFYNIGCAYGHGEYWDNWKKDEERVIKAVPRAEEGVIDCTMESVGKSGFFIDFQKISPDSPAWSWIDSDMLTREHGDKISMSPGEFDGFIYYDTVSIPTESAEYSSPAESQYL